MLQTFIDILHVFCCLILVFVVLLQQGKGGGMGAAFGGGASAQVFGGRGAGNLLTRTTAICAGIFMITSVSLAYLSSSGDRGLKAKVAMENQKKKDRGTARPKEATPDKAPSDKAPSDKAPSDKAPSDKAPSDTPPSP
jgi:preprotein translocase subunit SecG